MPPQQPDAIEGDPGGGAVAGTQQNEDAWRRRAELGMTLEEAAKSEFPFLVDLLEQGLTQADEQLVEELRFVLLWAYDRGRASVDNR